jgi:hypothetical protein
VGLHGSTVCLVRPDLIPLSASALVVGVMSLVLGSALNPNAGEDGAAQTAALAVEHSGRWLGMSVMFFAAAVGLTLGLPAILSLFDRRGRVLGTVAVTVFSIGVIGTAGYAMLMVFFRALAENEALRNQPLDDVTQDAGLGIFLVGWVGGFYLGILLLALALFRARRTPMWVNLLLLAFVVMLPFAEMLGRVGMVAQVLLLAVAFTGISIAAVNHSQVHRAAGQPSY